MTLQLTYLIVMLLGLALYLLTLIAPRVAWLMPLPGNHAASLR